MPSKGMQAVILCGGQGTRLREHTEVTPKPMVEVGGVPLLVHIMRIYARHGIERFVLCLGYKGDVIKQFFLNYEAMSSDVTVELGKPGGVRFHPSRQIPSWTVTLVDTGEEAGTGARLRSASRYLEGDTFALTYGDGVADVDLDALLAFHRGHKRLATITGVRPQGRFGEIDHDGSRVLAFNEKPQVRQGLINGGFFFFERAFLDYLPEDASCALERGPLERCTHDDQLRVHEHLGYWQCMDTFRDWQALDQAARSGKPPWERA
jgi:glucose-1-phosphate cytidylyltransferase